MDQDELKAAEEAFAGGYDDKPTERPAVEEPAADVQAQAEEATDPKVDEPQGQDATAAKPDPVADAIAQLAARMDKFQKSHETVAGKLGRVQQGFEHMQANLAAAKTATGQVAEAPGQADIKRAAADPAEWASLKEEWPAWGTAVEGLLEARIPKFDATAFEQKVNDAIEGKAQAMQGRIIDASLTAVFPGWKQDVASPEFKTWMDTQPEDIQQTRYSDDVGDVARVLNLYAKHQAAPKPTAAPAPPDPKDTTRKNRLAAAITPKGTGGHAPGRTELDEFEAGYTG